MSNSDSDINNEVAKFVGVMSRRRFLWLAAGSGFGLALAACTPNKAGSNEVPNPVAASLTKQPEDTVKPTATHIATIEAKQAEAVPTVESKVEQEQPYFGIRGLKEFDLGSKPYWIILEESESEKLGLNGRVVLPMVPYAQNGNYFNPEVSKRVDDGLRNPRAVEAVATSEKGLSSAGVHAGAYSNRGLPEYAGQVGQKRKWLPGHWLSQADYPDSPVATVEQLVALGVKIKVAQEDGKGGLNVVEMEIFAGRDIYSGREEYDAIVEFYQRNAKKIEDENPEVLRKFQELAGELPKNSFFGSMAVGVGAQEEVAPASKVGDIDYSKGIPTLHFRLNEDYIGFNQQQREAADWVLYTCSGITYAGQSRSFRNLRFVLLKVVGEVQNVDSVENLIPDWAMDVGDGSIK